MTTKKSRPTPMRRVRQLAAAPIEPISKEELSLVTDAVADHDGRHRTAVCMAAGLLSKSKEELTDVVAKLIETNQLDDLMQALTSSSLKLKGMLGAVDSAFARVCIAGYALAAREADSV